MKSFFFFLFFPQLHLFRLHNQSIIQTVMSVLHVLSLSITNFSISSPQGGSGARAENYTLKVLHIAASGQLESGIQNTVPLPAVLEKHDKPSLTPVQSTLHKALQILTENRTKALRKDISTMYGWNIGVLVLTVTLCCSKFWKI